jgi:hypothetical protein
MSRSEIARRADALLDKLPNRLPARTVSGLGLMREGAEYGGLVIELTATLAKTRAVISRHEQQELRAFLEATGMPAESAGELVVDE